VNCLDSVSCVSVFGLDCEMEISELAKVLVALGCPSDKSIEMAAQLDKRAYQLAAQKGRTYEEALQHLLTLMKQGWAAQGRQ
jgi:hypothetical protein